MNMKTASKKTHRTKLRVGHDMGTAVMAGLPRFNFSPRNLEGTKCKPSEWGSQKKSIKFAHYIIYAQCRTWTRFVICLSRIY